MSDLLNSLNTEKIVYINLKDNLNNVIRYLNNSKNALEGPAEQLENCFRIDGVSADKYAIKYSRNEIINKINFINSTIIPAIDRQINGINQSIIQEEQRIEEERRRAEEEARRQAEEEEEEEARRLALEEEKKKVSKSTTSTSKKTSSIRRSIS